MGTFTTQRYYKTATKARRRLFYTARQGLYQHHGFIPTPWHAKEVLENNYKNSTNQ